jgi:hypothetical protein
MHHGSGRGHFHDEFQLETINQKLSRMRWPVRHRYQDGGWQLRQLLGARMHLRIISVNNDESPLLWLSCDASIISSAVTVLQSM